MNEIENSTVYVIDDEPEMRRALSSLLEVNGFNVRTSPVLENILPLELDAPSCMLLDVRLRDEDGLDLQKRLDQDVPALPTVLLTGYGDIPMAIRAIRNGAFEFMEKPVDEDVLLQVVARAITESRRRLARRAKRRVVATFTPREREVFGLIVKGYRNKTIASEFGISDKTVEAHRSSIMKKANASTLADLIALSENIA
jgi:FixJ family two-component response regulator